uniref:IP14167p n=1 Tax=Drosophila melanogaster TaxID=7227 RepID=Q058W9_DROME|nr:IP14167p [Drosophila melanogaster]
MELVSFLGKSDTLFDFSLVEDFAPKSCLAKMLSGLLESTFLVSGNADLLVPSVLSTNSPSTLPRELGSILLPFTSPRMFSWISSSKTWLTCDPRSFGTLVGI